jgi:hypothetical protein
VGALAGGGGVGVWAGVGVDTTVLGFLNVTLGTFGILGWRILSFNPVPVRARGANGRGASGGGCQRGRILVRTLLVCENLSLPFDSVSMSFTRQPRRIDHDLPCPRSALASTAAC